MRTKVSNMINFSLFNFENDFLSEEESCSNSIIDKNPDSYPDFDEYLNQSEYLNGLTYEVLKTHILPFINSLQFVADVIDEQNNETERNELRILAILDKGDEIIISLPDYSRCSALDFVHNTIIPWRNKNHSRLFDLSRFQLAKNNAEASAESARQRAELLETTSSTSQLITQSKKIALDSEKYANHYNKLFSDLYADLIDTLEYETVFFSKLLINRQYNSDDLNTALIHMDKRELINQVNIIALAPFDYRVEHCDMDKDL